MDKKEKQFFPLSVNIVLLINIVVFIFTQKSWQISENAITQFALIPRLYLQGYSNKFSLISALFIHANLYHLLGNLFLLWIFGGGVEFKIKPLGFICFYILLGFVSNLLALLYYNDSLIPILGASGAVSGILAAHIVLNYDSCINIKDLSNIVRLVIYIGVIFWFFTQLVLSFTQKSDGAWVIHSNAFLIGIISMFIVRYFFVNPHTS